MIFSEFYENIHRELEPYIWSQFAGRGLEYQDGLGGCRFRTAFYTLSFFSVSKGMADVCSVLNVSMEERK